MDKSYDLVVAAEYMLRSLFGRKAAEQQGVKKAQDFHTRQILKFVGGEDAAASFVRSEIQFHSDKGVSPIWLSKDFTLPIFGLLTQELSDLLSPTGKGPVKCEVVPDDDAFFGLRFVSISADKEADEKDEHYFDLLALTGTKMYLDTEAGMVAAHDLVRRRLETLKTGEWDAE